MKGLSILRAVMVTATIVGGLFDLPLLAFVPILCMGMYVWRGLRLAQGDPDAMEALGVQIYFTAYATTIAAFAGMVLGTYLTGTTYDSDTLWLMAGLGILCTVIGLLAMQTLHDVAAHFRKGLGDASTGPSHSTSAAPTVEPTIMRELESQALQRLEMASVAIEGLTIQVAALATVLQTFSSDVGNAAEAGQSMRNTTTQLQAVLNDFTRILAVRIEHPEVEGATGAVQ